MPAGAGASSTPVPDIITLAATLDNDGIVNVPRCTGIGAFAVATTNVGDTGTVTVSADTGSTSLPLTIAVCETSAATAS